MTENVESTLQLAIQNEKTEKSFYENEANRANHKAAKALFNLLANQEEQHIKLLRAAHERAVASQQWPETVPSQIDGTDISAMFENCAQTLDPSVHHNLDEVQALNKAIAFEKNAEEFYHEVAQKCGNQQERRFFAALSKMEQRHRKWIEEFLHHLQEE